MVVKLVMVVDPMLEEVGRPMAICQKADAASDAWSTWWCAFYDKPKMCRITLWHKFDDDDHEHDDGIALLMINPYRPGAHWGYTSDAVQ